MMHDEQLILTSLQNPQVKVLAVQVVAVNYVRKPWR